MLSEGGVPPSFQLKNQDSKQNYPPGQWAPAPSLPDMEKMKGSECSQSSEHLGSASRTVSWGVGFRPHTSWFLEGCAHM